MAYIWENRDWLYFHWNENSVNAELQNVRFVQGQLIGMASTFGFNTTNNVVADSI